MGGGRTAYAVVGGMREGDPTGSIPLINEESDLPYKRRPLSKKLWAGERLETIWDKMANVGVEMYLARTLAAIDPSNQVVADPRGNHYTCDKLILAPGGTPRRLPLGREGLSDYRTLRD
jgi:3-phenylpropionate/trans-cinnamate dioxygenase ferredoxin reductase component